MAICGNCGFMLDMGRIVCRRCGLHNPNADTGNIGGVDEKKTTLLSDVTAATVERIVTGGPWDEAWGGGFVPGSITLMGGSAGMGKALAVDTPIPTPSGWTTMRAVKTGDLVLDDQGKPCRVVDHTRVMYDRPCYRLTFSDGERIIADAEHLWRTVSYAERAAGVRRSRAYLDKRRKWRGAKGAYNSKLARRGQETLNLDGEVRTTQQIAASLFCWDRINHAVRIAAPLDLPEAPLSIHPYVLGVWLGDGSAMDSRYCGLESDGAIARRIRRCGFKVKMRQYRDTTPMWTIYGLRPMLRALNVLGDKHIPQTYLRGSLEQRLELLRGLMDTDGDCTEDGHCHFNTTSPRIRDGFLELLVSLGLYAKPRLKQPTLTGHVCAPSWRFSFKTALRVFHLPRKAKRQRPPTRPTQYWRYIVAAEQLVVRSPVKCIEVDSPSKLYLAGRHMIPTHNTTMLLQLASVFAKITNKRAYFLSAEQAPGEVKLTAERLQLDNMDMFRVMREFGAGADISEELLKKDPPSSITLDSVSALCGKDKDAAVVVAKNLKKMAVKFNAVAFLICHMNKQGDYAGLYALQHEVDTLATLFGGGENERELQRLQREGHTDETIGGVRLLTAWKNRYGPTGKDHILVMTSHGIGPLPVLPPKEKKKKKGELVSVPAAIEAIEAPVVPQPQDLKPPDAIEVNGQKLVRVKKKTERDDRAKAVEGEALKRPRPAMPKVERKVERKARAKRSERAPRKKKTASSKKSQRGARQ